MPRSVHRLAVAEKNRPVIPPCPPRSRHRLRLPRSQKALQLIVGNSPAWSAYGPLRDIDRDQFTATNPAQNFVAGDREQLADGRDAPVTEAIIHAAPPVAGRRLLAALALAL